mgnify:CR=1 FL=1
MSRRGENPPAQNPAEGKPPGKVRTGEKLMLVVAFTLVLSSMSATMFNIVLPEMSREFAMSYAQVSWVSTAYLLIYAIGSAIYGKLADTFRLKNLLTSGWDVSWSVPWSDWPPRPTGWCFSAASCRRPAPPSSPRRR